MLASGGCRWHVGLSSCAARPDTFYSRAFDATGADDNRQWILLAATAGDADAYAIKNTATNRCLAAEFNATSGSASVVLFIQLGPDLCAKDLSTV